MDSRLQNLSERDQALFQNFGFGPKIKPPHFLIHRAIEAQALMHPDAPAVSHRGETISYRELNRQANLLSAHLIQRGVQPGDHIALFLERSISMVVGILAILKSGAAYVPQDCRIAPASQLQHVAHSAQCKFVLTLKGLKMGLPDLGKIPTIAIDEYVQDQGEASAENPQVDFGQLDLEKLLCFLLFTSGTTGFPNGVMVTHKNLCNILLTSPGDLGMQTGQKVSQILNIAFDMAAWEILGALSHGCELVIRGKSIQEAVSQVDVVIGTPSILSALDDKLCRNVKVAAVAGEPCPVSLAEKWSRFCRFHNSCGPTEVTIVNTVHTYDPQSGRLTIGKPTPNNSVYILNEDLSPCAIGEIGEMWAGGDCVSLGYIGNAELTEERYKDDPFLGGGKKMFRTRDLGRWTADGELEHFGRTDDQVKIRGFRVELDSVSTALEKIPQIEQAVTLKLDSRNLVAFVRPSRVDVENAKNSVAHLLPYYCTPSLILAMDEFPVTNRGKIDKRALTILAVEQQRQITENVIGGFL
jgi:amino acid adenylation domain-containing protein